MATTSTYAAARAALYANLQTAFDAANFPPNGIYVFEGAPLVPEPEFVAVLNGTGTQKKAVMGTRHPRDEAYKIFVLLVTQNSDPADATTPLDRVFTMMGAVEDSLRTDPSLGNIVRVAELEQWDLDELQGSEARGATMLLTVHCEARLN